MILMTEPIINEKAKVDTLKLPLDPIHGGLRFAVFGSFLGAGVLGFAATALLLPNPGALPLLIAGVSAVGTSTTMERTLKNRWTSGRYLVADSERIALTKHGKIEGVVNPEQQVNVLTWKFEVKKEGPRAKKGWYLLGFALRQDDNYVVVYTTISREDFEEMPLATAFIKLEKPDYDNRSKNKNKTSIRTAGEQKRLHDAEIARQIVGGDMLLEDFVDMIAFFQKQYPRWMI